MRKIFLFVCVLFWNYAVFATVPMTGEGMLENVAGTPGRRGYSGDGGDALKAHFANPLGIAIDRFHNIYIADTMNHRVRRIDARTGEIDTVAGTGKPGFSNEGGHADMAQLRGPTALTFDRFGNLFIADTGNQRIRMMTPKGYLYTVAGNGRKGYEGEGAKAHNTALYNPTGLAVSNDGELYIADTANHRIRKIDKKTGFLVTVAGNGEAGNDGDFALAVNARLNKPSAIVFDKYDNLYIADTKNHQIRFVDQRGQRIFTLAGDGRKGYKGDSSGRSRDARFNDPTGLALDRLGRVYVSDTDNQRIRRITVDIKQRRAMVESVVGTGRRGYNGDDLNAWDTHVAYPGAMLITTGDMLYFLDVGNNVVRRVQGISAIRPPTSYTSYGQAVQETDSRNFYEVLFQPQLEQNKK